RRKRPSEGRRPSPRTRPAARKLQPRVSTARARASCKRTSNWRSKGLADQAGDTIGRGCGYAADRGGAQRTAELGSAGKMSLYIPKNGKRKDRGDHRVEQSHVGFRSDHIGRQGNQ